MLWIKNAGKMYGRSKSILLFFRFLNIEAGNWKFVLLENLNGKWVHFGVELETLI